MKRCAFLSMESLEQFECYDRLLMEPLAQWGWQAEEVSWRNRSVNWDRYEAVIIRSPWDYQDDPDQFLQVLERIDRSSAHLENTLDIVRWNLDKRYLRDMESRGIRIVPTRWLQQLQQGDLENLLDGEAGGLIVKPVISANADDTFRLSADTPRPQLAPVTAAFRNRALMVQPFMESIIDEGEYSLFYFGGQYSHAILKRPGPGDFRVQEEHGGSLQTADPGDALRRLGRQTMQALPECPLYARADYVRTAGNNFALMELELIEPSLYFNMDPDSPRRFAQVFDRWMDDRS